MNVLPACLHACLCTICLPCAHRGKKWAMGTLGLELQQVVNTMWALGGNLGPRQEQQVLFTIEPSLQDP